MGTLYNSGGSPTAPAVGKVEQYTDSADRRSKTIDEKGVISTLVDNELYNWFINPQCRFAQRQAPGTLTTYSVVGGRIYAGDMIFVGNENASVQWQRIDTAAAPETGLQARYYGKLKKLTAAGKMYAGQAYTAEETCNLRGRTIRFQFKTKVSVAATMAIRIGVMQLTSAGTADTIPSTANLFFTAMGAASVDPTPGANLAYIAPKAGITYDAGTVNGNAVDYTATTSWVRIGVVVDVPTNCRNLIVLVWTNGQPAANDELNVSEFSVTDGQEVQDWTPVHSEIDFGRCLQHYAKTFAIDTAPAQNAGVTTGCLRSVLGKAVATALAAQFQWRFPINMWKAPGTVTTYNPGAANAQVRQIGGTAGDLTATATANITEQSVDVTATGIATGAVGDQVGVHLSAEAFL